ncbi:MAG TPA: FAD-binding protein [Roseomonas sp.]|jgi:succinate dehydrogenase/fumarate reductase flavoprotein subunit
MNSAPGDRETDLLVAGAGAGGMTAALVGALEGLDVLLCEASQQAGGTTATSAGTLWIPGNRQSRDAGFADDPEDAARYMDALLGPGGPNRPLREAYLATGPEAIDYLMARSAVRFVPCGLHPDYHANRPGAALAGRAIVAATFDGRRLGADFARLRPPIRDFMILGGMMVGKADIPHLVARFRAPRSFLHAARLMLRHAGDRLRHARGTRLVMGNALAGRLLFSLRQCQVPLLFGTRILELIADGGTVRGAVVEQDGQRFRVLARRGVVLATGGFGRHAGFREAFMPRPTPAHSFAAPDNQGDGIALGARLGARIAPEEHGSGAFWTPASVTRHADGGTGLFPHLSLDRAKPGLIAVNAAGRRFVNEGDSYHDVVEAMFRCHATTPCIPAWLICEAGFIRRYGLGAIHPGTSDLTRFLRNGMLTAAPDLAALARAIGVDAAGLADSVARHNGFARTGQDLDFGKGDTALNRFNGDPAVGPNPCLAPIMAPPFCAMAVWPAEIACGTGLTTDADARVLDAAGRPIPGLFACGNDMASIMAGSYPGPGTTLGPAIVFGYRAAKFITGKDS